VGTHEPDKPTNENPFPIGLARTVAIKEPPIVKKSTEVPLARLSVKMTPNAVVCVGIADKEIQVVFLFSCATRLS
jgi:hypothetical protein